MSILLKHAIQTVIGEKVMSSLISRKYGLNSELLFMEIKKIRGIPKCVKITDVRCPRVSYFFFYDGLQVAIHV